jgi:lysophospholipase L1-like esterase
MRSPSVGAKWLGRVIPGIATVAAQAEIYADLWTQSNQQALMDAGPLWIVLGDSMSQGIGASTFEGGWVHAARSLLERDGRPYRVINLSRTGAGAADVLARQLPQLQQLPSPALVTVLVGANDMRRASNRRRLVDQFRAILSTLPTCSAVARLPQPVRPATTVNSLIEAYAAA